MLKDKARCGRCIVQLEKAVEVLDELELRDDPARARLQEIVNELRRYRAAALVELLGGGQDGT